jgi:carbonic anhydrase
MVIEQCINLFKTGIVQPRRVETFNDETSTFTQPRIHAVVYDPKDGKLRQLQVDFKEYLKDIDGIYNSLLSRVESCVHVRTYFMWYSFVGIGQ